MELRQLLRPQLVEPSLRADTKIDVISELVKILAGEGLVTNTEEFTKVVMAREELGSTGVGMGIAIPHGKSGFVKEPAVVFGKSQKGIDYDSLDGEPAKLFFLIAVPEESNDEHLKILSGLSRKLMHEDVRSKLEAAESYEEVINAFA